MQGLKLRSSSTLNAMTTFDPGSIRFRNAPQYPQYLRSVCINAHAENIPSRKLYEPANLHALVNDHDYLCKEQQFTERCLSAMNVTVMTNIERQTVESATRGQLVRRGWLCERTKRLHASNFGKICLAGEKANMTELAQSLT